MATRRKARRTVRKTSSYKRPAKRAYKKRRAAAPRQQRLVVTFVNAPPGTMVSTATLGKKSGRPVKARY